MFHGHTYYKPFDHMIQWTGCTQCVNICCKTIHHHSASMTLLMSYRSSASTNLGQCLSLIDPAIQVKPWGQIIIILMRLSLQLVIPANANG